MASIIALAWNFPLFSGDFQIFVIDHISWQPFCGGVYCPLSFLKILEVPTDSARLGTSWSSLIARLVLKHQQAECSATHQVWEEAGCHFLWKILPELQLVEDSCFMEALWPFLVEKQKLELKIDFLDSLHYNLIGKWLKVNFLGLTISRSRGANPESSWGQLSTVGIVLILDLVWKCRVMLPQVSSAQLIRLVTPNFCLMKRALQSTREKKEHVAGWCLE